MEDNVFQSMSLYFVFAGSGTALSLDNWLGIEIWGRFPANTVIPELALSTVFGIIFLSAGIRKLRSPMWRRGLGAYYFFLLPLHRRFDTSFLTKHEVLMRALNYMVLVMELGALLVFFVNGVPLGLVFWFLLAGFAGLLSSVFVFTWLGESLVVGFTIILWLLLDTGTNGLGARWIQEVVSIHGTAEQLFVSALFITLVACLWSGVVAHHREFVGPIGWLDRLMRYMARYVWGFVAVDLFSEKHMQGPVIYRVFAEF